jgi:putative isomerase
MMLSFDSADLGFSALIQLVKSKTADGFIPNWATPQHKRTWSQPPIASRVLHEMVMKHKNSNTSWVVELLFDDLLDWNQWFNEQRRLLPLNITCLGGPDSGSKGMQEGRWESE